MLCHGGTESLHAHNGEQHSYTIGNVFSAVVRLHFESHLLRDCLLSISWIRRAAEMDICEMIISIFVFVNGVHEGPALCRM